MECRANAFIREDGRVFRTYFIDNRGDEQMGNTWNYLGITALGRQEAWEDSPGGLPADTAVPVVELPRRGRRGQVSACSRDAAGPRSLRPRPRRGSRRPGAGR